MIKQLNFLVGLPRAGNTIFGSIMNQNPKIAVTPNSVVSEICREVEKLKRGYVFKNFSYYESFDNVCNSIFPTYYKNWNYDFIIDRGPWGCPPNLKFLKDYFDQDIKIIVLVRDVLEILQSFLKHSHENPDSFINQHWAKTNEEKCDMLMNKEGLLMAELIGVHHLTQLWHNKQYTYLVEYDDLINKPKETIQDVYTFLGIPFFEHNFETFKQFSVQGQSYDDTSIGKNLHIIRENGLKKTEHDSLPQSVIDKYGNLNLWRTNDK